jgi:hypothetical protein
MLAKLDPRELDTKIVRIFPANKALSVVVKQLSEDEIFKIRPFRAGATTAAGGV